MVSVEERNSKCALIFLFLLKQRATLPLHRLRNLECLSTIKDDAPCGQGSLDFAGGGPVHIAASMAGLAYCIFVGRRKDQAEIKPHNLVSVFLGTGLLW
jgi:hypothetical protein